MMKVQLPYGRTHMIAEIPDNRIQAVLRSRLESYTPPADEAKLVEAALQKPIGSRPLEEIAVGKEKVVLIASDHTRPVPSKLLVPPMLNAIRKGNPDAKITILIATGCHRNTTKAELEEKFGPELVVKEEIVVHDCMDEANLVTLGTLPSGGVLRINRLAAEADLLLSEGFIEPHFFAGFSGGRKSILPGIASRETVYWNHNAAFIHDMHSRTGILEGNLIHRDMIYAAKKARLAFICNVVINSKHQVIGAFAGDCEAAHEAGAAFVKELCMCETTPADIVITTNNGYPLDQNIYQTVKGMSTAEAACKPGGVIIMVAGCEDGHGGDGFAATFASGIPAADILAQIEATHAADTQPDQWQSQIFARILSKFSVVLVSHSDPALVRKMQMHPAKNVEEALEIAYDLLGRQGSITVIPEGISTIIC